MQKMYGTKLTDVRVFFGPSAKACCYEVTEPFLAQLKLFSFWPQTIMPRGKKLFFNNALLNRLLLEAYGILPDAIEEQYNACTLCDLSMCSYRRSGLPERQMTVAFLRSFDTFCYAKHSG
jgi:copper oxidase (laccase) domain-containing protein